MPPNRDLTFEIIIEGKKAVATIKDFAKTVKGASDKIDQELRQVDRTFKQRLQGGFQNLRQNWLKFTGVIVATGYAIKKLSEASNIQEQAETDLASALKTHNELSEQNLNLLKKQASAIQDVTTVGDEQAIMLQTLAINMGISLDKVDEVTKGAIGLGKSFQKAGLSQEIALKGIALAYQGNFTQLQRYIPELRTVESETEKMAILQRAMANGFQQATDEAKNQAGQAKQLSNLFGDLKEDIGDVIKNGLVPLIAAGKQVLKFLIDLPSQIKTAGVAIVGVIGILRLLSTVLAGFSITIGPVGWLIAGLSLLASALIAVGLAGKQAIDPMDKFRTQLAGLSVDEAKKQLQDLEKELEILQGQAKGGEKFMQEFGQGFEDAGVISEPFAEEINAVKIKIEEVKKFIEKTEIPPLAVPPPDEKGVKKAEERVFELQVQLGQKSLEDYKVYLENRLKLLEQNNQQILDSGKTLSDEQVTQQLELAIKLQGIEKQIADNKDRLRQENLKKQQDALSQEESILQLQVQLGQKSLEDYRDYLEGRLALLKASVGEESLEYLQLAAKIDAVNKQIGEGTQDNLEFIRGLWESAFQGIEDALTDFETAGDQKWQRIWDNIAKTFIRNQLRMLLAFVTTERTKQAEQKKSLAISATNYAKEAALALVSVGKVVVSTLAKAGAYIAEAAAKIYSSFASIPFGLGIPAAAAVIAGMVTAFNALKKSIIKLAKGTVVDEATLALIGETGDRELVTPEKDALTVMREMASMVLDDVRSVMLERQAVEVAVAGAGGESTIRVLSDMRDLLSELREKKPAIIVQDKVEGRDLVKMIRYEEDFESERNL